MLTRQSLQQAQKSEDQLIYDLFKEKSKIDLTNDQLTARKTKKLQALLSSLQSNLGYHIKKKKILGAGQFKNLVNTILIVQQVEIKARQIGIKDDFTITRMVQQPPAIRPFRPQQQLVTTISEHKDIVSAVQSFRDQRFFLSGSHDGTVKVFDVNRIEQDFTAGSVSTIKVGLAEEYISYKVSALRALEMTDSFLVGTNTGQIQLFKIDRQTSNQISQLRTFRKADSEVRKIETLKNELGDDVFVYVTTLGEIVVEDIRSKQQAIKFSMGKERGLVSGMIQRANSMSTCISTLNGYCVIYDLRCNLISNVFQLLSADDQSLPIMSMGNFNRVANLEGVESADLVAIGFQSNNNEVGFWNLNDLNENVNPSIFLTCSDRKNVIIQNPKLRNLYKTEQFKNFSNTLDERCYYDFVGSYQQMDLIQYLKDPLTIQQNQIKERWLTNTKNVYACLKQAFEARSSVCSLICLPQSQQQQSQLRLENTIITASNDRVVQAWTLANDGGRVGERPFEKEGQGTIICQPYGLMDTQRRFTQCKSGDVYIIQDYEIKGINNMIMMNMIRIVVIIIAVIVVAIFEQRIQN